MNFIRRLFNRRVRGFRLVEVLAACCLAVLVLSVYLTKAAAGRDAADLAKIDRDIADEQKRIRLLKAELAHLEQPERLEALARRLDLRPVPAQHEAFADGLMELAHRGGGEPAR